MAAAVLIADGRTFDVPLTGTVTKGEVLEWADSIAVANESGVSGETISAAVEGIFELDKETGVAFTVGQKLYWDATNNRLDATGTNIPAGLAAAAAASGDTRAKCLINAGPPA